jgi:hypothetical protein
LNVRRAVPEVNSGAARHAAVMRRLISAAMPAMCWLPAGSTCSF